ncbi:hypothetical protein bcere0019_14660 [Bacillus cereus Rock3-28]|nr:hypothetical protein bcere0019_14660 [Bacillus cereus Rock3-28]MBJ7945899.1 hypothetical protein [Bacillus cereus group sp. N24]
MTNPTYNTVIFIPHSRAVKRPPKNSAGAKKLGGRLTARKSPIGAG